MRIKNRARSLRQVRSSRSRSKRGVSPVIGVILMVAATIVIAGVVMAMLGGFGPPKKQYMVTASASENATGYIYVTYNGGPDSAMVSSLSCSVNGKSLTLNNTVGFTSGTEGTAGPNNDQVVVAATFKDNTTQVILDTWV